MPPFFGYPIAVRECITPLPRGAGRPGSASGPPEACLPATAVAAMSVHMVPAVAVPEMNVTTFTVNRTAISVHRRSSIHARGRVYRIVLVHYPRRSNHDGPSHHDRIAHDRSLLVYCYRGRPSLFIGVDLTVVCRGLVVAPVRERRRDKHRRTGYA